MNNLDIISNIASKTIGFELSPGVKAMSKEESWEWHRKHSRIDKDGHLIISSNEIGDGSYEKKYKNHNKLY